MKFDLIITGKPELIHSFINDATTKIDQLALVSDKLRHRIKLILVELLTNLIKHSLTSEGKITVSVNHKHIEIIMINKGVSFLSTVRKKTDVYSIGEVVEIFFSETNNHYIKIIDENKLEFLNPYEYNFPIQLLKDHYGLHIITLAADNFFYEYNDRTGEDYFIAYLNF